MVMFDLCCQFYLMEKAFVVIVNCNIMVYNVVQSFKYKYRLASTTISYMKIV